MFSSKSLVSIIVLCIVHESISKPYSHNESEGRGVGSTLWGWITYPFSWWSSDNSDIPYESNTGMGLSRFNAYDSVEIGRYNVTLWCNDQTCTTIKCDRFGCMNITCNMYDTDITGECRSFNTKVKPEEPTTPKSSKAASQPPPQSYETETTLNQPVTPNTVIILSSTENDNIQGTEDRPLELEAVLSSTVTENVEKETGTA
ncbi:uncharacterized protein LOC120629058 [Pararge aegeria]|uniref:uncharacterized protein LOC120629058 n=1 Tax=Pararge aegeria TaxID=116150 RepID=UPI0019D29AFC|nr:uncharacterized protein LOC120629058 [Pararge aegeria]